jgi:hypothetical protein
MRKTNDKGAKPNVVPNPPLSISNMWHHRPGKVTSLSSFPEDMVMFFVLVFLSPFSLDQYPSLSGSSSLHHEPTTHFTLTLTLPFPPALCSF